MPGSWLRQNLSLKELIVSWNETDNSVLKTNGGVCERVEVAGGLVALPEWSGKTYANR